MADVASCLFSAMTGNEVPRFYDLVFQKNVSHETFEDPQEIISRISEKLRKLGK